MSNVSVTLGAGSRFMYDATSSGTFTAVEGVTVIPATNNAGEPKAKTTVNDTRVTYGIGLKDSPDFELTLYQDPEDAEQKAFLDACSAGTEMDVKIEMPNLGSAGMQRTFKLQPLGVNDGEINAEEWVQKIVPCKQNTDSVEAVLTPES